MFPGHLTQLRSFLSKKEYSTTTWSGFSTTLAAQHQFVNDFVDTKLNGKNFQVRYIVGWHCLAQSSHLSSFSSSLSPAFFLVSLPNMR